MGTSLFQNQGLTDRLKCKMHEDHRNQLENHHQVPQVEEHITNVPVPKIKELNKALKGHAKSYEIELQDNLNPLNHSTKTRPQTESHLEDLLKTRKDSNSLKHWR